MSSSPLPLLAFPLALLMAVAPGCTTSSSTSTPPERIKVSHVLIAFQGSGTRAVRSKAEAETLANQIFERAKKGESFQDLARYSDDTGGGVYALCANKADERMPEIFWRGSMVKGFGDVAFSLPIGGIGMCAYDPANSRFGWHIIKRLE